MAMKYQIGDVVWHATFDSEQAYVTCPDCLGTGRLRVIMADGTAVSIECEGCRCGYDPPTGRIKVYDRRGRAESGVITGVRIDGDSIKYSISPCWCVAEANVYLTADEAKAAAVRLAAKADADERTRIATKEKPTRSWSWNATYHRRCIREKERDLAYHKAKLEVAAIRAKEPAP
jgi:hypothetical protein